MIESQSLDMIPPVRGREKLFGWYPPAYNQYAKVPYKKMAVLDDYVQFNRENCIQSQAKTEEMETTTSVGEKDGAAVTNIEQEDGSSVLSTRLNAVRQELSRKRINVRRIQQSNFDSAKEYMNIPADWTPTYPQPNLQLNIVRPARFPTPSATSIEQLEVGNDSPALRETKEAEHNKNAPTARPKSSVIITQPYLMKSKTPPVTAAGLRRPHTAPVAVPVRCPTSVSGRVASATRTGRSSSATRRSPFCQQQKPQQRQRIQSTEATAARHSSYESDLDRYQWLMQIQGDPFNLKTPHLPQQQPYFCRIPDVHVASMQPAMQKQNRDTFFYNTIPHRPASFDISPAFTSEKYNAVKNKLRSEGKWDYSYKSFSFVY